jgi:hypothetical protein
VEVWRDIQEYEGLYQVSNHGRVRSLDRFVGYRGGRLRKQMGRILSPGIHPQGYLRVSLQKQATVKQVFVHRLVAAAFLKADKSLPVVNHINAIPNDNRVSNLEWCTQSHNVRHAFSSMKQRCA